MFTKEFDRRVHLLSAVLGLSILMGVSFGTYALWPSNLETGYRPQQPIEFSHAIMAGKHEIPCGYCHTTAEKGPHAGMPTLKTCMNCHERIQPRDSRGGLKPGIAALLDHFSSKKPVLWEKVHDLADFVYFDHSRHMAPSAGLDCADCHGDVKSMERVERIHSLKMGWCLDCHMQPPPEGSPQGRTTRAPIGCTTCHR
ncbi:MAG: cytochrome c3 family protein [Planctomycetes bacterium]|nr:cytochrome c3 family protein [Planctomycetota bacterium]